MRLSSATSIRPLEACQRRSHSRMNFTRSDNAPVRKHAPAAPSAGLDGIALGFVDSRSSAPWFRAFARPEALAFGARAAREDWQRTSGSTEPPVLNPRTWLLRTCLQRHGPFDCDDAPGSQVNGRLE